MSLRGQIRWARAARLAGIATGAVASVAALAALAATPQAPRLADDIGLLPPGDSGRIVAAEVTRPSMDRASPRQAGETLARAVGSGVERKLRRLRLAEQPRAGRGDGRPEAGAGEGAEQAPAPPPAAVPSGVAPESPPPPTPTPAAPVATSAPTTPPASPAGRSEFDFER